MKTKLIFFFAIIFLASCEKNKDDGSPLPFHAEPGSIYISNEGLFQTGTSTITNFNPADGTVSNNLFQNANATPLGDICQSMNIINGKLYLVVNGSGKIEVCDKSSMHKIKTITGMTSPRYVLQTSASKAYVTDAYSNQVSIINIVDDTITATIPLTGFCEQMLLKNNLVYVTNSLSDYLYIINPINDLITDSIMIGKGANSIREDMHGKIWVLCAGDYLHTYNGALYRLDPLTKQIELNISFQPDEYPGKLCFNPTNDTLYFVNHHVWRMSITETSMPSSPFVTSSGNSFYGLGVDNTRNEIYVSDAIDYTQSGRILRYQTNGTIINNFVAGVIPGDFLFLP
jgi:DNA-binding beta-propeller fold protein YncE